MPRRKEIKGIVFKVDYRQRWLILATEKRTFLRLPLPEKHVTVGQEITLPVKRPFPIKWLATAALFLLLAGASIFGRSFFTPEYHIALDINPSLELTVNRYQLVILATGFNSQGQKLLEEEDLLYRPVNTALEKVLHQAHKMNFLRPGEENLMMIAVTAADRKAGLERLNRLRTAIPETLERLQTGSELIFNLATPERHRLAADTGCSVNRIILYQAALKKGMPVTCRDVATLQPGEFIADFRLSPPALEGD